MLIFCHLCIGAIIGLFLARSTRDKGMVALAAIGSILPDLVDKPVGYLVYGDILGHGRLYLHTLLFLALLACAGLLAWRLTRSRAPAVLAGLVGLHQLMDLMWLAPVTWLYPFLGPFPTEAAVDLGGWLFSLEVYSVSEWVFLVVLALVGLSVVRGDARPLACGSLALLILGIATPAWLGGLPLHLLPDGMADTGPMLAFVSIGGSLGLWLAYQQGRAFRPERKLPRLTG